MCASIILQVVNSICNAQARGLERSITMKKIYEVEFMDCKHGDRYTFLVTAENTNEAEEEALAIYGVTDADGARNQVINVTEYVDPDGLQRYAFVYTYKGMLRQYEFKAVSDEVALMKVGLSKYCSLSAVALNTLNENFAEHMKLTLHTFAGDVRALAVVNLSCEYTVANDTVDWTITSRNHQVEITWND